MTTTTCPASEVLRITKHAIQRGKRTTWQYFAHLRTGGEPVVIRTSKREYGFCHLFNRCVCTGPSNPISQAAIFASSPTPREKADFCAKHLIGTMKIEAA